VPHRYATIAFTRTVKQAQGRFGSRAAMQRLENAEVDSQSISSREREFIERSDSFYLATVGSDGWPYVQHRGGPPGFLHVLDEHTLGYADFRGNRQYISTGNLDDNDRASLFLMDYARRQRLKIYARLQLIESDRHPTLHATLTPADYPAHIERLVLVHVVAFDWNCSQHITPRFTLAEIAESTG
jgi:uncharacterized protein